MCEQANISLLVLFPSLVHDQVMFAQCRSSILGSGHDNTEHCVWGCWTIHTLFSVDVDWYPKFDPAIPDTDPSITSCSTYTEHTQVYYVYVHNLLQCTGQGCHSVSLLVTVREQINNLHPRIVFLSALSTDMITSSKTCGILHPCMVTWSDHMTRLHSYMVTWSDHMTRLPPA